MAYQGEVMEGRLVRWNDDKGFGFIEVPGRKKDVFLHISALEGMPRRPAEGDRIQFSLQVANDGRLRAIDASIAGLKKKKPGVGKKRVRRQSYQIEGRPLRALAWLVLAFPFVFSAVYLWQTHNPVPLLVYVVVSMLTFIAYAFDKKKAIEGAWRISEATLHVFELLGGWPGGLIAQYRIRHKGSKSSYQAVFWLIVFLHAVLWADYFLFGGRYIWNVIGTALSFAA